MTEFYWESWNSVMQQWVPSQEPDGLSRGYYRKMVKQPDGKFHIDVLIKPTTPMRRWVM